MSVATDVETSTRAQVLHLVVAQGPVTAGEIAAALDLTGPGVRRHLAALETEGKIAPRRHVVASERSRGRPAKRYVATTSAHEHMSAAYAELAVQALEQLTSNVGPDAVRHFAEARAAEAERRYRATVDASGAGVVARVEALATALAADGYEATARSARGGATLQLCQGHCPVQQVAARYPELCDAETAAFARLLGIHVQRLATLARGGHACTTSIQTHIPNPTIRTATVEGQP